MLSHCFWDFSTLLIRMCVSRPCGRWETSLVSDWNVLTLFLPLHFVTEKNKNKNLYRNQGERSFFILLATNTNQPMRCELLDVMSRTAATYISGINALKAVGSTKIKHQRHNFRFNYSLHTSHKPLKLFFCCATYSTGVYFQKMLCLISIVFFVFSHIITAIAFLK